MTIYLSMRPVVSYEEILLLLLIAALNIFKEKYSDNLIIITLSGAAICAVAIMDGGCAVLLCMTAFDLVLKRAFIGAIPALAAGLWFTWPDAALPFALIFMLGSFTGFIMQRSKGKEARLKELLDEERRLRYELEQTKAKLLNSAKEIATIAEIKESNRIAREIHDSVGHTLSGILIQLQAAYKLREMDGAKSNRERHYGCRHGD